MSSFIAALVLGLAATAPVDLGGLKSSPPAAWKEVSVSNSMRVKQFTVPGKAGDADLVVYYFGQGQGGSVKDNLERWKKQFEPPPGRSLDDVSKVSTVKLASTHATVLDISGTYLFKASPMAPGPAEPRPDHRMLAVVLETPNGNYYIKLTGPEKTIKESKPGFDAWIKAFK